MISVRVRLKDKVSTRQEIEKRVRKNMDPDSLKKHMKEIDWTELLMCEDVDIINGIL